VRRTRTIVTLSLAALAALPVARQSEASEATREACGLDWTVALSPSPRGDSYLEGVFAPSPDEAWAAGWTIKNDDTWQTLLLHWDGSAWTTVPAPSPTDSSRFLAVAGSSADDVWVVGGFDFSFGLALHWDGTAWTEVDLPANVGVIRSLLPMAADNVWGTSSTGVVRWDGRKWQLVERDSRRLWLEDITHGGPAELWAVGWNDIDFPSADLPFIKHGQGQIWQRTHPPRPQGDSYLYGAATVGEGDVWAVGQAISAPYAVRWVGTHWKAIGTPFDSGRFESVEALAGVDLWAVGTTFANALIAHWDGQVWAGEEPISGGLRAMAMDPTGSHMWAVGFTGTYPDYTTLTLERCLVPGESGIPGPSSAEVEHGSAMDALS
jgi:hypothetical protein